MMNERLPADTLWRSQPLQISSALLVYMILALALFGVHVLPHFSTSYLGRGADPSIFIWDLVWWPHALAHHLNPFISKVVWPPTGYNLAWATSLPGPSLIMAPLTRLFGPVVSYNLLCLLGPALAAWSTFLLCRQLCKRFWPALLGGYIFGFSSYMLGQMRGHLFLVLVFPIPLAAYLVLLRVDEVITARSFVILLVSVLALEFSTSTEIFATMTLFTALALVFSYLLVSGTSGQIAIANLTGLIVFAYCVLIIVVAPYLYFALAPGEPGPINSAAEYSADLLNFFLPTHITLLGGPLLPITEHFRGNLSENGAYLGPGLTITIALFAWNYWRSFSGQLLILCLGLVFLASLGPILHIGGKPFFTLPWILVSKAPLIDQALPCRFSVFVFLIAAIMAALYLSTRHISTMTRFFLGLLCLAFLMPNGHPPVSHTEIPAFFRNDTFKRYLAKNDSVLVLPYGTKSRSLLWQAYTHMYFRLAIARFGTIPPEFAALPILKEFETGTVGPDFTDRFKAFLFARYVDAIMLDPRSAQSWPEVLSSIGLTPVRADDIILYTPPSRRSGFHTPIE